MRVLAVDDEPPALEDLTYLLRGDHRIGRVLSAGSSDAALRLLECEAVDAVFLDIRMPGLDGLDLVRVLRRFAHPPAVVFVTAYEDFAVDAFALKACDYLLKPVGRERLAEAVRRVAELIDGAAAGGTGPGTGPGFGVPGGADGSGGAGHLGGPAGPGGPGAGRPDRADRADERIPVDLGGVTRFVSRDEVAYAEAQGDYVRLHAGGRAPLVRVSLAVLEERWAPHGFLRIHRGYLVSLRHVEELRSDAGRWTVRVAGRELPVARRHTRELRDLLVRWAPAPGDGPS
ncbi:LytTR family DNA-binding domain-containing protein [Streptomyces sp. PLK6-54]|uniref:LytTR family DNA-binding domain-containing protein n=1 Tax=Actinacidiphila acidipaludis TaxID=2873382 RepID=A0ABS7Q5T1_9ACTN|nr:LytTR family DNA-binding domain-containing protein [Streptomyces acidipaludis]